MSIIEESQDIQEPTPEELEAKKAAEKKKEKEFRESL